MPSFDRSPIHCLAVHACATRGAVRVQDEPTNHLDMETIDSLARAINNWDGGMVRPGCRPALSASRAFAAHCLGQQAFPLESIECKQCKASEDTCLPEPCCVLLQVLVSHDFRLISQVWIPPCTEFMLYTMCFCLSSVCNTICNASFPILHPGSCLAVDFLLEHSSVSGPARVSKCSPG